MQQGFYDEIMGYLISTLGPDPTTTNFTVYDKANVSGIKTALSRIDSLSPEACNFLISFLDEKGLEYSSGLYDALKAVLLDSGTNFVILDVFRIASLNENWTTSVWDLTINSPFLLANIQDARLTKMKLRILCNLFSTSTGRVLLSVSTAAIFELLKSAKISEVFKEEHGSLLENMSIMATCLPSFKILKNRLANKC